MMHYLDEAILIEILARLPVKSLLRFKCVSRQWRDLISNPVLVKAQLRISLRENPNPPQRLVLRYGADTVNTVLLNIADVAADSGELEDTAFTRLDLGPPAVDDDNLHAVASCHGLVCLLAVNAGPPGFFLHNPTTKETRKLPAASHLSCEHIVVAVGFGYDALNDDYKLMVGTRVPCVMIYAPTTIDIFSLRSNSWRRIGIVRYPFSLGDIDWKYSNGFLHWALNSIVSIRPEKYRASMLSFDVTKEEFHEGLLPMPSFTGHKKKGGIRLGVTGGGWLIAQRCDNPTEVWIMKDYCGPDSTWTKLCYFPEQSWSRDALFPWIRDGKIILCADLGASGHERIGIYDPEGGGSQVPVEVPTAYSGYTSIVTSYVESLVSPHV